MWDVSNRCRCHFGYSLNARYTQRGGRRPFGVCAFICGMDGEQGRLFTTDPAGIVTEWKANASGRHETAMRTYLENHYKEDLSEEEGIHLVLSCLMDVCCGDEVIFTLSLYHFHIIFISFSYHIIELGG